MIMLLYGWKYFEDVTNQNGDDHFSIWSNLVSISRKNEKFMVNDILLALKKVDLILWEDHK
jgi:hypothetical protein